MVVEIKEKLEELVTLLNDPEETVIEKEVKEKLEVILALVNNPNSVEMDKAELKEKLDTVLTLVNKVSVDPDIDIEYCEPDKSGNPYILVTYVVSEYNKRTRKIHMLNTALRRNTPEDFANQITFSIEEFKGEIDSVEMG